MEVPKTFGYFSGIVKFRDYNHQTFEVPKMEVLTYVSCMDTAYVRETPSPKQPYKAQYLDFRYLKCLVIRPATWMSEEVRG